jgi:hypothetical protein
VANDMTTPTTKSLSDENLDKAIKKVFRIYGRDLAAFFGVVHAHSKSAKAQSISGTAWRLHKER